MWKCLWSILQKLDGKTGLECPEPTLGWVDDVVRYVKDVTPKNGK